MIEKVAIIIATYNRPEYLEKCLNSLEKTFLKKDTLIYIVDDHSSDNETIELIKNFEKPNCLVKRVFKEENTGIQNSLLTSIDYCFDNGYDYFIILNSDMIVNNYFYDMMVYYKELFPNNIISGFNTLTLGENGAPRHPIAYDGKFYVRKKTCGAPCLGLDRKIYETYFKQTLIDYQKQRKSAYDTASTRKASDRGCDIICTVPSVADHIGFDSSMKHSFNPDVAVDFKEYVEIGNND